MRLGGIEVDGVPFLQYSVLSLEANRHGATEDEEKLRAIVNVLGRLRATLVLRDLNRLPMSEVAGELGISMVAAKSRLLRARHELRTRMDKYCGALGAATLVA